MVDLMVTSAGTFGVLFAFLISIFLILRHKSSLIFGIYPSKTLFYRLKYWIALLLVKHLRHRFFHNSRKQSPEIMQQLDKPQLLCDNPKSYDVVSFMAANSKGQKFMVSLERRRQGIMRAVLYLWLPEYGLLASPNLPDMLYFSTNGEQESSEFKGTGFHIYPRQAMKLWCLKYEGKLKQVSCDTPLLKVKLDLEFHCGEAYFDYNRDLSGAVIADAVAKEAWNEAFYMMLQSVDTILEKRTHYEQSGFISGEIQIADKDPFKLRMNGIRDHSFGTERCLSTINRYVYFVLFLEDGSSMVVGNLSQPSFFLTSLKVGYWCSQSDVYTPITESNFELYAYGEKGVPPKHQNFIVQTAEKKYFVQIEEEDSAVRYVGGNWESKVFNQFVSCTVNGVRGQGITEYLYRYGGGRPEEICHKDPLWYQKIRKFERNLSNCEDEEDDEVFFF